MSEEFIAQREYASNKARYIDDEYWYEQFKLYYKERLIVDPLIAPYEVLFDTTNKQFILYNTSTGNNEGYYVSLPLLLKAIMKTKYMPQNGDNNVYTLREYIKGMSDIRDELEALLRPAYHYMK